MIRTTYRIVTKHPTGYRDGSHTVAVHENADGSRYVTGENFGCSRDYRTDSNISAIRLLLAEHLMTLVSSTLAVGDGVIVKGKRGIVRDICRYVRSGEISAYYVQWLKSDGKPGKRCGWVHLPEDVYPL
jgi:hypothetical protein